MRWREAVIGTSILVAGLGLGAWAARGPTMLLSNAIAQRPVSISRQAAPKRQSPVMASAEAAASPFGPGYRLMVVNQSSLQVTSVEILGNLNGNEVAFATGHLLQDESREGDRPEYSAVPVSSVNARSNAVALFEPSSFQNPEKWRSIWAGKCAFDVRVSARGDFKEVVYHQLDLCAPASVVVTDDRWTTVSWAPAAASAAEPVAPELPMAADPSKYFRQLYYWPTSGKVGFHMVSKPLAHRDDEPGRDAWGALVGCSRGWAHGEASVDGTLPAGMSLVGDDLEGTPQEPGDWEVTVHLPDVHCSSGPDTDDYGNRDIHVHFHIEGEAARDVDEIP